MEKINITCRLTSEDVAFLDKLAASQERDRSYFIKKAVSEYIALHRWQIEEVERALDECEAGDFATDKQVKAAFAELRGVKIRWLNRALVSLRAAHAYIALDNPAAGRRTAERIRQAVERLSQFPRSGRIGTVAGTRELVVPGLPYLVVYRVDDSEIIILRVFHTRQDRP